MKKKLLLVMFMVALMTPFSQVKAQYPDVPKDVKEAADKMMAEEQASSDAAWEKAYPIIKEEAQHGRSIYSMGSFVH